MDNCARTVRSCEKSSSQSAKETPGVQRMHKAVPMVAVPWGTSSWIHAVAVRGNTQTGARRAFFFSEREREATLLRSEDCSFRQPLMSPKNSGSIYVGFVSGESARHIN